MKISWTIFLCATLACSVLSFSVFPISAFAEAKAHVLDLNGAWQLDRTENFEEYLKASGAPWWKRKLAQLGSSRLHQNIQHEGIHFEIESDSPVETRTETFVADGTTERTVEGAGGDVMTWVARMDDSALVLEGHGELGHRIIRRERVDGEIVMMIRNPDADAECKLYFRRVESD